MSQFSFFVATGLGMEEGLAQEIREIWPWLLDLDGRPHGELLPEFQMEKGGIEIKTLLHLGLQLNFLLKTANRILLRIAEVRVRDFPKLFQIAQKISWQDWIAHDQISLEVSAAQSRLNNEKRISETLLKAWKLKEIEKAVAKAQIFVRVFDDQMTVSLDTTGEHLHFRGQKKWTGEAPVRETLAAFCLQRLIGNSSWSALRDVTLVDPMVGSGTFLLEALGQNQPTIREFSFQSWKKCPKALRLPEFQRPWQGGQLWHSLKGFDSDSQTIQIAQKNLLGVKSGPELELAVRDVFAMKPQDPSRCWLILNPPYGERIQWNHTPQELLEALNHNWQPERIGILWTSAQAQQAPKSFKSASATTKGTLRQTNFYPLLNGGIRVQFQVWNRE